jgi:HK97 family phage major capsid protein
MFQRDSLVTEQNTIVERISELRSAEEVDTDALSAATVALESVRSQIAAIDAITTPAPIEAAAPEAPKSFGARAAEALVGAPIGTSVEVRTLLADPFGEVTGAQDVTFTQTAGYVAQPDAPVRFIDLLPTAPATSDSVTYIRETGFTNAAAARLAGASTPESELSFEKVSEPIANTAHRLRSAEETLADAPALAAFIDRRGLSGVRTAENTALLAASDTANGVKSVVAAATEQLYTGSIIDAVATAQTNLEELGFAPSTVVMTPAAWEAIRTTKLDSGAYLGAGPFGGGNGTLWGLRVVTDGALASGVDALVCDLTGATRYVRDGGNVATDRDIVNNLVTVRVQVRSQVAVELPEAFVKLIAD